MPTLPLSTQQLFGSVLTGMVPISAQADKSDGAQADKSPSQHVSYMSSPVTQRNGILDIK